jgi:error-prone DNA polymerase
LPQNESPKLVPHPFRDRDDAWATAPAAQVARSGTFAELCVTSNYTFLQGASHPEELVRAASAMGLGAIAITDLHSLAGIVRANVAAMESGVQLVVGARCVARDVPGASIWLHVASREGYARLCRLLTLGKRRAPKGQCWLDWTDIEQVGRESDGLVATIGFDAEHGWSEEDAHELLRRGHAAFDDDRFSLALSRRHASNDHIRTERLARFAKAAGVPLLATNDVLYHDPSRRMLQDVLTCIRHGCTLTQAGQERVSELESNAERRLKCAEEMSRLFAQFPAAIARSCAIAAQCANFSLNQLRYEYPEEIVPAGTTAQEHLEALTWRGMAERYPPSTHPHGPPDKVRRQIGHELALIRELNYAAYFLTVEDLVRFARSLTPPILCQGRGAAANSAVCYCLGVTAVDPDRISLLFERFISKERNEPPDIDIDFEHERREEVIQYIYRKYGRERAALTAEVISYRRRSAIRDVGKALGLSLDLVDRLAKDGDWWDQGTVHDEELRAMGLNPHEPTLAWLAKLVGEILGFPRHLSQHVGGFIITRTPLCEIVPVENAAMADRTVVEWDKDDIDAMGMLKVDVLGLGMLTAIRRCLGMVNAERGVEVARCLEGPRGDASGSGDRDGGVQDCCLQNGLRDHQHSVVSGSDRLAEEQGTRETDILRDGPDATLRAVWPHHPVATCGSLDPVAHRREVQPQDHARVHAEPAHRERFTSGSLDPIRDRDRIGPDQTLPADHGPSHRGGSLALRPDPQTQSLTPTPPTPHHLVTSTPLLDTTTPRHLDTSPLELHTVPPEDPATYAMIQRADTIGVFQIESRAQMSMLPRFKPRCFYDLVIEVAIVRPGPIQGDMVHPYLRRRNGEEAVTFPNDAVREVLGRTLGVPLFQEQAMQLAIVAAGFTPGEADKLRRAMAAWKRKGDLIYRFGGKLIAGMIARGYPEEFAHRCFEQIKGFSEYGFPESHAASFALLVYVSCWLKRHHPAQFAAAIINSQPMGFYAPAQIIRDAREHGVEVLPVDVLHSAWDCTTPQAQTIRLGMRLVRGLSRRDADAIAAARDRVRPSSMLALWRSSGSRAAGFVRLARADAFGSMGLTRQQALWQAKLLRDEKMPLFEGLEERSYDTDVRAQPTLPAVAPARQVAEDYTSIGLSLKCHPMSFVRGRLARSGVLPCSALLNASITPDGEWIRVAGLVLVRQRPGTASGVVFITLEDETGVANLILWARTFEKYRKAARLSKVLLVRGRVQREGEVVHVHARGLRSIDVWIDEMAVRSRDFH